MLYPPGIFSDNLFLDKCVTSEMYTRYVKKSSDRNHIQFLFLDWIEWSEEEELRKEERQERQAEEDWWIS